MLILFLEIETERPWPIASNGPAFIAAHVRQNGHQAELLKVGIDQPIGKIVEAIAGRSPDLLGVSLTTRQWLRASRIVPEVREHLDIPVLAGGIHATFAPEIVLGTDGFDYVCIGEGEGATLDLLEALSEGVPMLANIANIWSKNSNRPSLRSPVEPDAMPLPARDMLGEQHGVRYILTGRSCPYGCAHCSARSWHDLYSGQDYGRRRSPENVMDEIEMIQKHGDLNYIIFLDDTFTVPKSWVERFCTVYRDYTSVGFTINARVDSTTPEMLDRLAEAGCKHVIYGVESGSERIRREVMKRKVSEDQIFKAFEWTKARGILVTANYMLGLPGETAEDIESTLALNKALQPDDFGYAVYYPYPGTPMRDYCREMGYMPDRPFDLPCRSDLSIMNLPDLTKDDIRRYYDRFTRARVDNFKRKYGHLYTKDQLDLVLKDFMESAGLG